MMKINVYPPIKEKRKYHFKYGISNTGETKEFGFIALNYDIKHLKIWDSIYPLFFLLRNGGPIFARLSKADIHFNFSLNEKVKNFYLKRAEKMGLDIRITAKSIYNDIFNISTEGNALAFGGGKDSRLIYGILEEVCYGTETYSAPPFSLDNKIFTKKGGKNVSSISQNVLANRIMPVFMSQKRNIFFGGVLGENYLTSPWQQYYDSMSPKALQEFSLLLKSLGIEMNCYVPVSILPSNIVQKILYERYPNIYKYQQSTHKNAENEKNLHVSLCKLYHDIDFTNHCSEELFKRLLEKFIKAQTAEPQEFGFRDHRKLMNKEMRAIIYKMQYHSIFTEVKNQIPKLWQSKWIEFIHSYVFSEIDSRFLNIYKQYAMDIDDQPDSKEIFHINVENTSSNIVIIGCCRSGTKFISKHLGLGHEKEGENGIACWHAVVDDNPYYTIQPTDFVLHQVRHPMDVISSCHAILLEESWNLILANIKQIQREDSLLLKCMKLWYYWNKMAEKRALATYRVEVVSSDVPKDTHSRKDLDIYKKVSWADMENEDKELTNKIRELARRYGYESF